MVEVGAARESASAVYALVKLSSGSRHAHPEAADYARVAICGVACAGFVVGVSKPDVVRTACDEESIKRSPCRVTTSAVSAAAKERASSSPHRQSEKSLSARILAIDR